jgi:hypothetical protein
MLLKLSVFSSLALLYAHLPVGAQPAAPPLPAPPGRIVTVSTEPELRQAVRALTSNTTLVIQPGTYRLAATLVVNGPLTNVAIRGATDRRDDVVLVGAGMTDRSVPHGIWTGGGVNGILIANLTIRDFFYHCIIFNGGTEAPRLYNVRLLNAGQQIVKSNPDDAGGGVDNGVVEYSAVEYTVTSRDSYTNGVDVLGGRRWTIRNNQFRNIRAPLGQMAGPAVLAWRGAAETVTEANTFIDCQRAISYGLEASSPPDHSGGAIRNNFIFRRMTQPGDAGITVFGSPDTVVAHNTIVLSGTYPNAIEYRFAQAAGIQIVNNLTDAAIVRRDGASATVTGNYTRALPAMFLDAPSGDLHLRSSASAVIDRGVAFSGVSQDWDGQPRVQGPGPDIGADELNLSHVPDQPRIVWPTGAGTPSMTHDHGRRRLEVE